MNRVIRFFGLCTMLLLVTMISGVALSEDRPMTIGGDAMLWGGSCEQGFLRILAGSRYFLTVDNRLDRPLHALVPGWPEGYALEAALDLASGQPFIATPGLMERLEPTRLLSDVNQLYQRRLAEHTDAIIDSRGLNLKEFVITIPWDLAGHTLTFRALYQRDMVRLESPSSRTIKIIPPCDRSDSARVVASRIYEAWLSMNCMLGVTIADSMLDCDLSDPAGWEWALSCASSCGQYDKAIIYLDRLYQDYGTHGAGLDPANPPPLNRDGTRDPQKQAYYERLRNTLLQSKAEQEQQQQQK